ncbi:metal cation transporter, ZIP family protein (macronuclear) [Tetrahymena thermophila SB210]|uniref:Metal cation transporter, ZIP family protein n=1 Tax=Tetrahymena thermophila (strain SB210) TaxID=312017 RepID=Q22C39_TETTS|nr:metal cation transporter, ZIP family protein [Tetrahymena thermophila SB210]EAR82873.1 metal cation transporter, ZIP family protein [Tetrahymena thermophila SB210]|eukprot:XP_001030536.1 metal cation transporter, ZIP family protein [Tetrahymena thermophila SB210]
MNKKLIIALGIIVVVVLAHGSSHSTQHSESEHPYFKQLKNYMQKNVTSKYGQVALSIFIVSFPSIPVFLSLSFLGRVLKKKGDKNNFSSSFLTLLLAFACGTLLGDVMLHILPYLFSQSHSHSHDHHHVEHSHSHLIDNHVHHHDHHLEGVNQKPSGCPFANLFGSGQANAKIPQDAAHAHLHAHDHSLHQEKDLTQNQQQQNQQNNHDHDHNHEEKSSNTQAENQHPHDHEHEHDHGHDHEHAHDHDHNHGHSQGGHKCNDPNHHHHDHDHETPHQEVHIQSQVLKEGGQQILNNQHDHSHDHEHDHGHGHSHSVEEMKVPLMIVGGIIIFIILDYIFMKIHNTSSNKDKKVEQVEEIKKNKKLGEKSKNEDCDEDSDGHDHSHHHHHSHGDGDEHSAVPFLIGDFLHNFTDGLAIGAAYTVSFQMGITSTFVIMIHELPHEIGDFAHLIKKNYSLTKILQTQFLTSLGALIGGFIGLFTGEIYKKELLSLTAGGFLYMCCSQVIPEIQADLRKDHSFKNLISIIISISIGIALMVYVAMLE